MGGTIESIRILEELSLNAWPCLHTIYVDGWVLRLADSYTRRANSVNPIYSSTIDVLAKIEYCEDVYSSRRQATIFKLTEASQPTELDAILAERGYCQEAPTSVQTLDLTSLDSPRLEAVSSSPRLTDEWLDAFVRLSKTDRRHVATMRRILEAIAPARCFLSLRQAEDVVAVGLAVSERGYVGLMDIVTAAEVRGQGLGSQLMLHLMRWGKENGAERAYLQVMLDNAPALRLYDKLGFQEIYRYWYRVRPFTS